MAHGWGEEKVLGNYFLAIVHSESNFHWSLIPFILIWVAFAVALFILLFISFVVPYPRRSLPSEKKYTTIDKDGKLTEPRDLPCWVDRAEERHKQAKLDKRPSFIQSFIEPGKVFMTLVIPAYNEEKRLLGMLEESVNLLERHYSNVPTSSSSTAQSRQQPNGNVVKKRKTESTMQYEDTPLASSIYEDLIPRGWEILLVNDGSSDKTLAVAEHFARTHMLPAHPRPASGPWTPHPKSAVNIPPDSIRMITLDSNRGKGGAVTHGMRHARGMYVLFADADGASDITDLPKLVAAADEAADFKSRAVAVGSRAHMVNSAAVVKRSKLRNFLMHSFHLFIRTLTPPKTAKVKDTQCGFKLFTRAVLPYVVPHMHMEGWIFDVEMLMLAEFAGVPVVEVPIGWKEVAGSKLDVIKDSLGMAWNLFLLRICWGTGIYSTTARV